MPPFKPDALPTSLDSGSSPRLVANPLRLVWTPDLSYRSCAAVERLTPDFTMRSGSTAVPGTKGLPLFNQSDCKSDCGTLCQQGDVRPIIRGHLQQSLLQPLAQSCSS